MSRPILSIGIHGASGRMGTRLIQLIAEDPGLELAAALVRRGPSRHRPRCRPTRRGHGDGGLALELTCRRRGDRRDDRLLAAAGRSGHHRVLPSRGRFPWSLARPASARQWHGAGKCGGSDPDLDRAQHEPGSQSAHETRGRGRAIAGLVRRHRDHRTASQDQERRPQRDGPSPGRVRGPRQPARPARVRRSRSRKPAPARRNHDPLRCGSPIAPASTPLFSACRAKPWN